MWRAPNDPQVYGALEIDATGLLQFIADCRDQGHKVTPTHLVGRAIALALREVPELNTRLSFGRITQRETIDVFFITSVEDGNDLSGVKVERVDAKSVFEVARELRDRSAVAKSGRDPDLMRSKRVTDALPLPVARVALRLAAWLSGEANLRIGALGLSPSPFGSVMVTSVGMFGIEAAFAPLSWMYKVPLLLLAGAVTEKALVVDGRVEARPVLPVTATIDHRFIDGFHLGRAMDVFRKYLASPAAFENTAGWRGRAAERPS